MTRDQLAAIHIAKKTLGLEEADYRTILRSIGKVESSKLLDQKGFERVMAFFESRGFSDHAKGPDYWQKKAGRQSDGMISDRQIRMIEAMAAGTPYEVPGLCWRHSHNRTRDVGQLSEDEAYEIIEMLKGVTKRQEKASRQGALFESTAPPKGAGGTAVTDGPARTRATGKDADEEPGRGRKAQPAEPPARERSTAGNSPAFGGRVTDDDDDIPF